LTSTRAACGNHGVLTSADHDVIRLLAELADQTHAHADADADARREC
jgi:hypothetical protein